VAEPLTDQQLADQLEVIAAEVEAECREMHGFGFDKWGKDCCVSAKWAIDLRAAAVRLREADRDRRKLDAIRWFINNNPTANVAVADLASLLADALGDDT
jgi:hypothetical protein